MTDNRLPSSWENPRRGNGYGDSRDMSWRSGCNRGTSVFEGQGFMNAGRPYQQSGYRMQNIQLCSWQRGPTLWRDQGWPVEMRSHNTTGHVHAHASGRQLCSTDTRPNSESKATWSHLSLVLVKICVQVRFHIMSERELREQKAAATDDSISQLNFQQLLKSLCDYGNVEVGGRIGFRVIM